MPGTTHRKTQLHISQDFFTASAPLNEDSLAK
jgi:hypothetical protein